jgi:integrase
MAVGMRKRHLNGCRARDGGRCNCDGGHEAWVYLPREKRKIRKTFAREAEARSWRVDALAALKAGTLRTPSRITIEQAAWLWLESAHSGAVRDRSGHIYKPGTLREYGRALKLRALREFGTMRLSELTRDAIQRFVDRLLAEGLAPSTVANTLNPLQAIYRHAVRREVVLVNPTREVELPADRGRRERIASAPEAARLIAALPEADRPIWATAFYAGLRRGELLALRACDVDLGRSEISVLRSWDQYEGAIPPKSKAGTRTVPIIAVLRDHLDARALPGGTDLLLGREAALPFAPKSLSERAQRTWKAANKRELEAAEDEDREPDLLEPITLHECRHTFASLLIDAGVNAKALQEFMGHATIEETFSRYGHLMPGAREQARELVDAYMEAATAAGTDGEQPQPPSRPSMADASEDSNSQPAHAS